MFKSFIFIPLLICMSTINYANVSLSPLFSNKMILQRDKPIKIWGNADIGEKIEVKFSKEKQSTITLADGTWSVTLSAKPAGGPHEIIIKGKNTIQISDVMMGDVWICSGQSNMEWQIEKFTFAKDEANMAKYPNLRLFNVRNTIDTEPQKNITEGRWKKSEGDSILNFSAVGYFFGRYIHTQENIPVGLITTDWGGTNVEAWTSLQSLSKYPHIMHQYDSAKNAYKEINKNQISVFRQVKKIVYNGNGINENWQMLEFDKSNWNPMNVPASWDTTELKDYIGSVWFSKSFDLPLQFIGEDLLFNLGKIDQHDMVWVNGTLIGERFFSTDFRNYIASKNILKPKGNEIVVRVFNINQKGGMYNIADWYNIQRVNNSNGWIPLSGEWRMKKDFQLKEKVEISQPLNLMRVANEMPASLYNAMLYPLQGLAIKGIIWYQGEANANRAVEYRTLFPEMIQDWRKFFNQGDIPFLYVQLANFRQPEYEPKPSTWAELREAQNLALQLPNVGLAVAIDIGEADNIHPKNKQEVGRRLGLEAQRITYANDTICSSPLYKSMKINNDTIYIEFNSQRPTKLITKGNRAYDYIYGFTIANANKEFKWAKATIINDSTIAVFSKNVKRPVAVRYAWENNPDDVNLYNTQNLPASPFRTDDWELSTTGVKYGMKK